MRTLVEQSSSGCGGWGKRGCGGSEASGVWMILKLEVMGFAQCDKLLLIGGFPRKHARHPRCRLRFSLLLGIPSFCAEHAVAVVTRCFKGVNRCAEDKGARKLQSGELATALIESLLQASRPTGTRSQMPEAPLVSPNSGAKASWMVQDCCDVRAIGDAQECHGCLYPKETPAGSSRVGGRREIGSS